MDGSEQGSAEGTKVLRELVDALAEACVTGLDDAGLLEVVTLAERAKGAAAALQARATDVLVRGRDAMVGERLGRGEIDEQSAAAERASTRCEVALARRCSPALADRHVGLARALVHEMPETMAALAAGSISEWRATIMARETACLSVEDRREVDARLADRLTTLGDRALTRAAQRVATELDQEAQVRRRARAASSRRVSVRPAPDGMAYLTVLGPLVDVVGAYASLVAAEKRRWIATGDEQIDAARATDTRGAGAWIADTALARLSGRDEGGVQPVEVGLVMTPSVLLPGLGLPTGAGGDVADVPGHGSLPGAAAREHLLRLLDAAAGRSGDGAGSASGDGGSRVWLRRLFTEPSTGQLVALDSRRRLFEGGLRRFLELRDPTCRIPWCDAPTRHLDHAAPAADGGQTTASNGVGLCARHNLAKEARDWSVTPADRSSPGGHPVGHPPDTVRITTPAGMTLDATATPLAPPGRGWDPGTADPGSAGVDDWSPPPDDWPDPEPDQEWLHELDAMADAAA